MATILEIADLKRIAQRKVPKLFFDYADSGSWTEGTYRANESDFQKLLLFLLFLNWFYQNLMYNQDW